MVISVFNLVKIGVVVPAALSSLWLFKPGMHSPLRSSGTGQMPASSYGATTDSEDRLTGNVTGHVTGNLADIRGSESVVTAPLSGDADSVISLHVKPIEIANANDETVIARRMRVENILGTLNRINEVSMQMDPDRAATLEPVLMDIAEETMALSDRNTIVKPATEQDLGRIEATVKKLTHAVARSIEPEMSL